MAIRKAIVLESDFITNNLILARTYKGSKIKYIRRALSVNIETFYVVDKDFISHNLSLNCSINGISDLKIAIGNNWKQVIEKQIIVNNEWKQVIDICILTDNIWRCESGSFYYILTPFEMYGKEHKSNASYDPEIIFSKHDSTTLRMSSTAPSLGTGYIFASFDTPRIDGMKLRVDWEAVVSYSGMHTYITIYDGEYDRSSVIDFPSGSGLLVKGAGNLQSIASFSGNHDSTTIETIDVSSAQLDKITIMIGLQDNWTGNSGDIYVSEFMILDQNDVISARVDKSGSFTQEVSGTYADYGTWGVNGG